MLEEPSHLPASHETESETPMGSMPAIRTPPTPPVRTDFQPGQAHAAYPTSVAQHSLSLRTPGCVVMTMAFFICGIMYNGLLFLGALALGDVAEFLNAAFLTGFFFAIVLGLWSMYRWAARLVMLYCLAGIVKFGLWPLYSIVFVDDYLTNAGLRVLLISILCAISGVLITILGAVYLWYRRTYRYYRINDLFPNWERALYLVAIAVFVFDITITLQRVPDSFEEQRTTFQQLEQEFNDSR